MYMKNIRLITFDATNTLLQFRVPPSQQYRETAAKYGVEVCLDDVTAKFKTNFKMMSACHENFGKRSIGWEEWWRIVVRKTFETYFSDNKILECIATDLIESYKTKSSWTLAPGTNEILKSIKDSKIVLGVISNFDPRLDEILHVSEVNHFFDFVLTSYSAGFMKPDKRIFSKAISLSGIQGLIPREALHIGDNVQLDYWGAKHCGWQAAILGNKDLSRNIDQSHVFSSLKSVMDFINVNR